MLTLLRILLSIPLNTRVYQLAPPYVVPSVRLTPRLMLFVEMKQLFVALFIPMSLQLVMVQLLLSSLLVQTLMSPMCTVSIQILNLLIPWRTTSQTVVYHINFFCSSCNKVQDILRNLCILESEPHQKQQNPAEPWYQTIKRAANRVLDRSGARDHTWLLCLQFVCYLLNHVYNNALKGVPLQLLSGITIDISPLLRFHF
jgi:hypothetical protein